MNILYRKRRKHEARVEEVLGNIYMALEFAAQERRDQHAYPRDVRVIEPRGWQR